MTERLRNQDVPQSNIIISEISELSRQISHIYSLRDFFPGRYLPPEDWTEVRRLHALKDQKTIDLLLQRKDNPDDKVQVVLHKYPKEKIHPFSMNNVSVYVPSEKNPQDKYMIRTELTDLRRPGVIEDSLQAAEFLGDVPQANETGISFIYRTSAELIRIQKNIQFVKQTAGNNSNSVENLEDLSLLLITERLLPLRNSLSFPPNSSLSFLMYEDRKGNVLSETVNLNLDGRAYEFEISGQRLLPIINELGGYDKIVTIIS